jgi:hypothetical protein
MSQKSKLSLSRQQLAAFLTDPDAIRAFERVFRACDSVEDILLPIAPLSAALAADFSYSAIPNIPGIYPIKIPAAYLKASAGGPFILTLSTGVAGKDAVTIPIAKSTDTIDSGPLLFDVEVDSVGNLASKSWTPLSGHNTNGSWVKFADGTMMIYGLGIQATTSNGGPWTTQPFFSPATSFTFPVAFTTLTQINPTLNPGSGTPWLGYISTANLTGFSIYLYGHAATDNGYIQYFAIGRWK